MGIFVKILKIQLGQNGNRSLWHKDDNANTTEKHIVYEDFYIT